MPTIMDDVLRPRPKWVVLRRANSTALLVERWASAMGHPNPNRPSPHTEKHETTDAQAPQWRVLGPEGKRQSSFFIDDEASRSAVVEALNSASGLAFANPIVDAKAGEAGNGFKLSGFYPARFVWRKNNASPIVRTSDISRAAGIFVKLIGLKPGIAYVQTLFPLAPGDLNGFGLSP